MSVVVSCNGSMHGSCYKGKWVLISSGVMEWSPVWKLLQMKGHGIFTLESCNGHE